jgi:hypothetical protein
MDRRGFLQHVTAPAVESLATTARAFDPPPEPSLAGHSLLCEFELDAAKSPIYQDLRTCDGSMTLLPPRGVAHILPQHQKPTYSPAAAPHLGPKVEGTGLSGGDLLARRLLAHRDDPVRRGALHARLHMPRQTAVERAIVNPHSVLLGGSMGDTVIFSTGSQRHFETVGQA